MDGPTRFQNREAAGELLGETLRDRGVGADAVLAVPRGGLPLGRAVADALDAPLDVVVAKKVGAPGNPEYALGAVADDGTVWRNEEALDSHDESYFERRQAEVAETARDTAERYRAGRDPVDVAGRRVVVVDDGLATGSTAAACLRTLRDRGAERVVLAVPVGPPETVHELSALADEVVCLVTPERFVGVGGFYDRFEQVSDERAMSYLAD
jgi:predicted phosphoribosyltransferase